MNRNTNFRYKSIVPISKKEYDKKDTLSPYKSVVPISKNEYDKKDTLSPYKSLLAESFVSGIGTGAGYQIVARTIDNILGPKTINIKNEGEYENGIRSMDNMQMINIKNGTTYGTGNGCMNELTQFIDCVKENGYYQCNKSFNEFEKCFLK
jgi:hypothetical protein